MELISFYIDLNSEALEQQMLLTTLTSNRGYDVVNRFKLILPNASTLTFRVVLWNPSVFVMGENIFVKLFSTFFPANSLTKQYSSFVLFLTNEDYSLHFPITRSLICLGRTTYGSSMT